jgi:hypothetical protein
MAITAVIYRGFVCLTATMRIHRLLQQHPGGTKPRTSHYHPRTARASSYPTIEGKGRFA